MSASHEHYRPQELTPPQLYAYRDTFFQRTDIFAKQTKQGSYISVKQPLTEHHIHDHLYGKITLGTYALSADSTARWICLDADDDDVWQQTLKLASQLLKQEIPAYIEPSRRGGHLWPCPDIMVLPQFL